jgi:integrase
MALDWSAFRERDRTVRFTRQVASVGEGFKALKGKRARTALVLPAWWEHHRRGARGLVLGATRLGEPALHASYRWLKLVYEIAGVDGEGRGWHTLRHTYARLFIELGGRLEELQRSLGTSPSRPPRTATGTSTRTRPRRSPACGSTARAGHSSSPGASRSLVCERASAG